MYARAITHQPAANEEDCDGDVLHIPGLPFASPTAEVLEEDVSRAVEKDQSTFDEFSRRPPFLSRSLWTNIPCPTHFGEAARPTAKGEESKPEEDTAFDPMRKTAKDLITLLRQPLLVHVMTFHSKSESSLTKNRPRVAIPVVRDTKPKGRMVRSTT